MGDTVLVTGCSTGIGHATAKAFLAAGWSTYATARRPETLADLAAAGARTLALDVTDDASMRAAVEQVGVVDVLVNNAGYSLGGPVEEVSLDDLRRQFETNVFGLVRLCQLVLPGMRARGSGRILNLSSMGGRLTLPGGGSYHATKHAVEALSDALRFEVAPFGVQVVVIEPGPVATAFGDTAVRTLEATGDQATSTSPYADFNAGVAKVTAATYSGHGFNARFAWTAERVAQVIVAVATTPSPRPRYVLGTAARTLVGLRAVLPDRWWDAFLATQYPRP